MSAPFERYPNSKFPGTVGDPDSSTEEGQEPTVQSSSIEQTINTINRKVTDLMIKVPRISMEVELIRQNVSAHRECWKKGRIDDVIRRAVPPVNEISIRAYRCPRSDNEYKAWILVEVITTAYRSVKVFELVDGYFIARKCPFVGSLVGTPISYADQWETFDTNITHFLKGTHSSMTASTARLSDMDVTSTSEKHTCGCLAPSAEHGGHGNVNICLARQLAQKMTLRVNHMIQKIRFVEIYSIKFGSS